jgi:glycine/D-amino acid oxidase-like deaminating enzyme
VTPRPLTRRAAIKALALASFAPEVLASCARAAVQAVPQPGYSGRRLARVQVSPSRVIRHVTGLRPFRRSGFRVAAESWGDKSVVHNYGHGGGGITLSWGSSALALELARATPHRDAAVIGCGALGLSTARLLQDAGFGVTIYARDLPPNTTSNIAGAQWAPTSVVDTEARTPAFEQQFVRASRFAYRYFQNLAGPKYGVWWRENYVIDDAPTTALAWEIEVISELLPMTSLAPGEHAFGARHVRRFLSMHIEPATYLAAVLTDYRLAGGRVVVREFPDRQSLAALPEPLIVNCTGLSAGKLFDDPDVMPVKGQLLVLAPQADVDYITIGPAGLYMMPRQDGIILGGSFERGEWSLEPTAAVRDRILSGQAAFFASML